MAKDVPMGMEFANWQNAPALFDSGTGKGLLAMALKALQGGGDSGQYSVAPPETGGPGLKLGGGEGLQAPTGVAPPGGVGMQQGGLFAQQPIAPPVTPAAATIAPTTPSAQAIAPIPPVNAAPNTGAIFTQQPNGQGFQLNPRLMAFKNYFGM